MSVAAEDFDPLALLRTLNEHSVNYVVIGGIAATIRGSDSITGDVDICYQRTKENVRRLATALNAFHAKLTSLPEGQPLRIDERSIWNGDTFTFDTDYGHVDCLANPSGTTGFDDIRAAATSEEIGGTQAVVCSLDDLIRMKEAAGRIKDRVALEQLYSLKRLIERS
jgi:predicted nucleotidyltransferase